MRSCAGIILPLKGRRQAAYAKPRKTRRKAKRQAVDKLWADDLCKGCGWKGDKYVILQKGGCCPILLHRLPNAGTHAKTAFNCLKIQRKMNLCDLSTDIHYPLLNIYIVIVKQRSFP